MGWISCGERLPPDGVTVTTKVHRPGEVAHNVQPLKRYEDLWYFPSESSYVYYTPTHWKPIDRLTAEQGSEGGGS